MTTPDEIEHGTVPTTTNSDSASGSTPPTPASAIMAEETGNVGVKPNPDVYSAPICNGAGQYDMNHIINHHTFSGSTASSSNRRKEIEPNEELRSQQFPSTPTRLRVLSKRISAGCTAVPSIEGEVMKRRLHIEYQGDEAKILKLMKTVTYFSIDVDEINPKPVEAMDNSYQNMKVLLHNIEYSARRDHQAITVIESTRSLFNDLSPDLKAEIDKTRGLLSSLKNKAAQIKQQSKNDLVLKAANSLIKALPTTKVGEKRKAQRDTKLQTLKKKKRDLSNNMSGHIQRAKRLREELGALKLARSKAKELLK
jgi:hypothetical protein